MTIQPLGMSFAPVRFLGIGPHLKKMEVAFATDLDETYWGWQGGNRRSKAIEDMGALREQNRLLSIAADVTATIYNTSNSLRDLKKPEKAALMDDTTVDVLILENGKKVFFNEDRLDGDEWVSSLKEGDADREWRRTVTNVSNWDLMAAKRIIRQTLLDKGYQGDPDDVFAGMSGHTFKEQPVKFEFLGTHAAFDLIVTPNDQTDKIAAGVEADSLARAVVEKAEELGVYLEFSGFEMDHPAKDGTYLVVRDFAPRGVNKGSALQYVLKKMPKLRAVITAGDNELNDLPATQRPFFIDRKGGFVPNYPIVVGHRSAFVDAMEGHAHAVRAEEGQLVSALRTQLNETQVMDLDPQETA